LGDSSRAELLVDDVLDLFELVVIDLEENEVDSYMASQKDTTAVIIGYSDPNSGAVGHAFNVANVNGKVYYVDGQSGRVFNLSKMSANVATGFNAGVRVVPTGDLKFWVSSGWF
jgi:hypothetical protein